jgi:hypothetical protein
MAVYPFNLEIAGEIVPGLILTGAEYEQYRRDRGLEIARPTPPAPAASAARGPGRPSLDEAIAATIDELADELDRLPSVAAQARAVREALEKSWDGDKALPALRTIEIFIGTYRNPTDTRKFPRKLKRE